MWESRDRGRHICQNPEWSQPCLNHVGDREGKRKGGTKYSSQEVKGEQKRDHKADKLNIWIIL